MAICRIASVASLLFLFGLAIPVHSEPPQPASTPQGSGPLAEGSGPLAEGSGPFAEGSGPFAEGSGPFADGQVLRAVGSGTVASRVLQQASFEAAKGQIKFEIQILSVDSETRDRIYAELGADRVRTQIAKVTDTPSEIQDGQDTELTSRHTVTTGSIVSTAVMDQEQVEHLYSIVKESRNSKVIAKPTIIATDGLVAGMQQQVQRPFLSVVEEVELEGQLGVQSGIQVLSEGTDLTVQGDVDGEVLQVHTTIKHSRIKDVQQHHVYGIGTGQQSIQIPSHEVRQASAAARLLAKQTMLLDPYFQTSEISTATEGTPILAKIPYSQKMFKRTEPVEVTMNTIVLVKAKKL